MNPSNQQAISVSHLLFAVLGEQTYKKSKERGKKLNCSANHEEEKPENGNWEHPVGSKI